MWFGGSAAVRCCRRTKPITPVIGPPMQLTPRHVLLQFGHVLQQELFPRLTEAAGPLSPHLELLAAVAALLPLERFLSPRRARTRPAGEGALRPGHRVSGQGDPQSAHHARPHRPPESGSAAASPLWLAQSGRRAA